MAKIKTDDLIALICKAATERFSEDSWAPGVQIAHVVRNGERFWYVALHRYQGPCHERVVVFKTRNADLDVAVRELAAFFAPPHDAQDELLEALGAK